MLFKKLLVLGVVFYALSLSVNANNSQTAITTSIDIENGSSRALMSNKIEGWKGFFAGDSSCVSVIKNGAICGWTAVSAGLKCAWSYIKCIIPKCSKCCGGGIFSWACVPCKCSWDCSSKKCKEEFKNVGKTCKIATDGCVKAFNHLGAATKKFFENVGNAIKDIANKIKHAAEWVAQKAWGAIKWVWDQILKFLDLIKFFEVAKAIGNAFKCFGKLGSSSQIKSASGQASNVKNIAEGQGKNGVISKIDSYIPGFKAFICCMQSTAIGKVLNKWGKSLKSFHQSWKGLKVGSFLDDPALVVSLAVSAASGYSVGTSLDIAISTAFNIGLYWTFCAGFVTDVGVGVSIVVNLFRKFSFIPGQSVAISFSVGIPETPIGVGAGVVLPIGDNSIDFGAVNVEVGASNGISPVSVGGHVCDTKKLVEFNLLELLGNILTANNECPQNIPTKPGPAPPVAPVKPVTPANKQLTYGAQRKANWWGSLDKKGWSTCAGGSALVGLYRNSCNNVHCIEEGNCYEASDGKKFTECYNHNMWGAFDKKGLHSCNSGYFIAGFYRNDCDWIYCLEEFKCCKVPGSKYAYAPKKGNWWGSFDKKGWSNVPTNAWITGLYRNDCKEIYCIEEAWYSAPSVPAKVDKQLTYGAQRKANWWGSLDRKGWSTCATGSALVGLYRNSCNNVHCIEEGNCYEASHGMKFTQCYNHNMWGAFDKKGLHSCNNGYFLAGFYRNDCDWIYCLEEFKCCTVPGSRYAYAPKKGNWWGSFDKKGWSNVPSNAWITGLYRNDCKEIYCIEEAWYSAPIAKVNAVATEEMEVEPIEDRRLLSKKILTAHKEKVMKNAEETLRNELKARETERRLAEEEEKEIITEGTENAADAGPNKSPYKGIDIDNCGPKNIEATKKFEEFLGISKLVDSAITKKLCSDKCQKHTSGKAEPKECRDLRARACHRGLLGPKLNTEKKCCQMLFKDPENLVFNVRKLCAMTGVVVKPTKKQFCEASRKPASEIQKNFDIVNTIMDGCALHFSPYHCRALKRRKRARGFAKAAARLCPKPKKMSEQFGGAAVIGVSVAALLFVAGFGIKRLRSKDDIVYEQLPDF